MLTFKPFFFKRNKELTYLLAARITDTTLKIIPKQLNFPRILPLNPYVAAKWVHRISTRVLNHRNPSEIQIEAPHVLHFRGETPSATKHEWR